MAHDVFISYSSKDKAIADGVCARLEARGIRCWIAPRDVQPGRPYGEEIIDGIHNCRAMVLVLSSSANASPHIPKEIERAVSRGVPVIPLRIENVLPAKSLDYFISSVHWLDAITPPLEQHVDSLAKTIRTLLPEGTYPSPGLNTLPIPDAAAQDFAANKTMPHKPNWLLAGIGVALAMLLISAWFIWGRRQELSNTVGNMNPPIPSSSQSSSPPGSVPASGSDPVVGCWHWFNNASVVIRSDGSVTAGPFLAHWQNVNTTHHTYTITWPEAVDTVALSPDGRTLGGGNQYGIAMSASRQSFGPGIVGSWRWYNGVIVTIRADGTFSAAQFSGRWQMTAPETFTLTWPSPVDTLNLSPDQRRLRGGNQYGFSISGTKTGSC